MKLLSINKQTEAEKDEYLLDCFYDSGIIGELLEERFTIISGRKGAGKSAIAKYLEAEHDKYDVDTVIRLSIRNFNIQSNDDSKVILESILAYIAIQTAKNLLRKKVLKDEAMTVWSDFLEKQGLQDINDYESYIVSRKASKRTFSIKAIANYLFAKGELGGNVESEEEKLRSEISATSGNLFNLLSQSIKEDHFCIFFIDDISDYLDESAQNTIKRDIQIIQELLLRIQTINLDFRDNKLNSRYISLVREDLFNFMEGSNTGKIKSDSIRINWSEKDFASLLIKRMNVIKDKDKALLSSVDTLKEWFPDNIFSDFIRQFDTNRYSCNFYAYMAAISFNRPRDYLQFCYALRERLSINHPALKENIESAEIEYTDYLELELRNELYIASKVFDYDLSPDRINFLIRIMTQKDEFNYSELRTELNKFFKKGKVGHKKVEELLSELWRYGIIGYKEKNDAIISFNYLNNNSKLPTEKLKACKLYLHRGLWWFARKNKVKK